MNIKKLLASVLCLIFFILVITGCESSQKNNPTVPASEYSQSQYESSSEATISEYSQTQYESSSEATVSEAQTSAATEHRHNYSAKTIEPDCVKGGYTLYTCSCGNKYTADNKKALGHSYGDWSVTVQPTYEAEGKKQRKCVRCGNTETASVPRLEKSAGSYAAEVIKLVNAQRAKEGLSPVSGVGELNDYALLRSKEIVSNFEHKRPDGANPLDYVMQMKKYRTCGENIAYGYKTPEKVMEGWMNSPGHRANIMNENFTYIGVGCYEENGTLYWTQIFAG